MTNPKNVKSITTTLKYPIPYGDKKLDKITMRKPYGGDLRGVSLTALGTMKTDELFILLPRISSVALTDPQLNTIDPTDILAIFTDLNAFFG